MSNNLLAAALSSISSTHITAGGGPSPYASHLNVPPKRVNFVKTPPKSSLQVSAPDGFRTTPNATLKARCAAAPKTTPKSTLKPPGSPVAKITPRTKYGSKVDLSSLHSSQLISGPVHVQTGAKKSAVVKDVLYIETLTGKRIEVVFRENSTAMICGIKKMIYDKEGIAVDIQILKFGGQVLDDNKFAASYNIRRESTLHLTLRTVDGTFILALTPDLRSPSYDFDFTTASDIMKYCRGDHPYVRPCGWKRFALNVLDRYENNKWLGVGRLKDSDSMAGEWAVSYHGTGRNNLRSIAEDGFLLSKGKRFMFGHGIYTTPEVKVAELYASEFTVDGVTYKAVVQNRVNPANLKIVTKAETGGIGEYWITEKEQDVRPYGICIKRK